MRSMITLLSALLLALTACSKPVQLECPKLITIKQVPPIRITVADDGRIDANSTAAVFRGIRGLRASERFYLMQIKKYNERYAR